jgi:O-antigen/teichoic acid export membrane protein
LKFDTPLVRGLLSRAAILGAASVLGRGAFVLTFMILARSLSAEDLARTNFFLLTLNMIAAYATLGVGVAASRYFPLAQEHSSQVRSSIHALVALSLVSALVVTLLVPLIWPQLTSMPLSWLFVAALVFLVLGLVPASALVGLQMYRQSLAVAAASGSVLVLGALLAARESSVTLAFAAIGLSFALKTLGDATLASRRLGAAFWRPFRVCLSDIRGVLSLVGPMAITGAMSGSGAWVVGEMVRARWADLDYTHYGIGLQWYALGMFLPGMVTTVLFPLQVQAAQATSRSSQAPNRLLFYGVGLAAIVCLVILGIAVPLSPFIARAYGPGFAGESWMIWGFVAAAGFGAPAGALGAHLISIDRQGTWTACTAVWLAVLVASAAILTKYEVSLSALAFGIANLSLILAGLISISRAGRPRRNEKRAASHEQRGG